MLDKTEFASGAEAVGYYFQRGFKDAPREDGCRVMVNQEGKRIRIVHKGFLTWKVEQA